TTGGVLRGPVIGTDGTIYFGKTGRVYAVNPDGTERWSVEVGHEVHSPPSIGGDGTVYVGADGVHAFNPDGSLLWAAGDGIVRTAPIVGADGAIYVGSEDGRVYALNPDGSVRWEYLAGSPISTPPAIGLDGKILLTSYDSTAYALEEILSTNGGFENALWPTAGRDRANTGRAKGP